MFAALDIRCRTDMSQEGYSRWEFVSGNGREGPLSLLRSLVPEAISVERCRVWVGCESTMRMLVITLVIGTGGYGGVGTISAFNTQSIGSGDCDRM